MVADSDHSGRTRVWPLTILWLHSADNYYCLHAATSPPIITFAQGCRLNRNNG